jgi:hypothetical protein
MSHAENKTNVCPNCGFHTSHNYCAQCGQETHLHKETFLGLVMHFVAHYFHYDSKFWQTVKNLVTQPGTLTLAYWNKQRARYIPPISLYIFISTIYFIVAFLVNPAIPGFKVIEKTEPSIERKADDKTVSQTTTTAAATNASQKTVPPKSKFAQMFSDEKEVSNFMEKVKSYFSKFFFFMVPLLAFFLQLLFYKRKDLLFVNHAVFSLHLHCIYFLVMLTQQLTMLTNVVVSGIYSLLANIGLMIYAVIAFRNVYNISVGKSILYTIAVIVFYIFWILVIGLSSLFVYLEYFYHPH